MQIVSMVKLAICADIHGNTDYLDGFIGQLPDDIDAIVIAGDIPTSTDQTKSIAAICRAIARTRKPVYVMPGNYESQTAYAAAMKKIPKNVIDTIEQPFADFDGVRIVFIPGGDILTEQASYLLVESKIEAKIQKKKKKIQPIVLESYGQYMTPKTLVISHIPPLMRGKAYIDYATFGIALENFITTIESDSEDSTTMLFETDEIILNQFGFAEELHDLGAPIDIRTEHVGSKFLARFLRDHNAQFLICGHIHEQGGVATSKSGTKLAEGKKHKQLYYNVGPLMHGKAGIVTFDGTHASFNRMSL